MVVLKICEINNKFDVRCSRNSTAQSCIFIRFHRRRENTDVITNTKFPSSFKMFLSYYIYEINSFYLHKGRS